MVVMAFDEEGQAATKEDKVSKFLSPRPKYHGLSRSKLVNRFAVSARPLLVYALKDLGIGPHSIVHGFSRNRYSRQERDDTANVQR